MDAITVFVVPKPIIATIAVDTGSSDETVETYSADSTDSGNKIATGLKIELDGVESFDEVYAAADSYTYESENAKDDNPITANNVTLSGNYVQLTAAIFSTAFQ